MAVTTRFSWIDSKSRLLITLGWLAAYRIGFHVPVPGVDFEHLEQLGATAGAGGRFAFGVLNAFSGGILGSCRLFTLGVLPYLCAAMFVALLARVAPRRSVLGVDAVQRRHVIRRWTRFAMVPMCILQAVFLVLVPLGKVDTSEVVAPSLAASAFFEVYLVLALTTGSLIVLWISEQITQRGVGNGVVLVVAAGILARLPTMLASLISLVVGDGDGDAWLSVVTLSVLFLLIVVVVRCVTLARSSAE